MEHITFFANREKADVCMLHNHCILELGKTSREIVSADEQDCFCGDSQGDFFCTKFVRPYFR